MSTGIAAIAWRQGEGGRGQSTPTQQESSCYVPTRCTRAQKGCGFRCIAAQGWPGTRCRGTVSEPGTSPESVGEGYEGQRDHVVEKHDNGVLAPCVHVGGGIDGVSVEAALQQVGNGNVRGHIHAFLPVWGGTKDTRVNPEPQAQSFCQQQRDGSTNSGEQAAELPQAAPALCGAQVLQLPFRRSSQMQRRQRLEGNPGILAPKLCLWH